MKKKTDGNMTPWGKAQLRLEAIRIASGMVITTAQLGGTGYGHSTTAYQPKSVDHIISDAEKIAAFVLKK